MIIKTYKKALEHVKTQDKTKPIRLVIGNKTFEGVEFPDTEGGDDGNFYESWLLIKCLSKDVEYLSMKSFRGEKWEIFAETCGKDFIFMGKSKKYRERSKVDEFGWISKGGKEYISKQPKFQLSYL